MKVKIAQILSDINGKEIILQEKQTQLDSNGREIVLQEKKVMTLRDVIINSILTFSQDDDDKKKWEKYEIFKKLKDPGTEEIDLTVEEIALIKKSIGKYQPPLIMGQCWEFLEGK